ncbi:hypothetical protein [Desulfovibrio subterraneus]|uniref:Uncharacterized protein n=1 Tax=Desulfovibrio subterraneus TaxID=2718620 RepID=A0A7J0BP69_9BACT|nr:hypothetical protein [Desulfovibrio subterraneus]GFM34854.1 hypothetical protein DSM101010T_32190 [Desulfovibrio subterraneus]
MHERAVAQLLIDLFSPEYDAEERCAMLENTFPVIVERPNETEVFRNTASLIFRFDDGSVFHVFICKTGEGDSGNP